MAFTTEQLQQQKIDDIECLLKMYQTISDLHSKKIDSTQALYKIACLCGGAEGLSFNDKNDPHNYAIRNRYGRKKVKAGTQQPYEAGKVDFEILFRVKALIDANKSTIPDLKIDFQRLQAKLIYIIYTEMNAEPLLFVQRLQTVRFASVPQGDAHTLVGIKNLVEKEYPKLVLEKLKQQADELAKIQLTDKHSVYCFARKMVVIGELFHELGEIFPELKKEKKNNLFSLYNRFVEFRNGFIHFNYHLSLQYLLQGDTAGQVINTGVQLAENFSALCNNSRSVFDVVPHQPSLANCRGALASLSTFLAANKKRKFRRQLLDIVFSANQLFEILESLPYLSLITFIQQNEGAFAGAKIREIIAISIGNLTPGFLLTLKNHVNSIGEAQRAEFDSLLKTFELFILDKNLEALKTEYFNLMQTQTVQLFLMEKYGVAHIPNVDLAAVKFHDAPSISLVNELRRSHTSKTVPTPPEEMSTFLNTFYGKLKMKKASTPGMVSLAKSFNDIKAKFASLLPDEQVELEAEFNFSISIQDKAAIQIVAQQESSPAAQKKSPHRYAKMIHKEMAYLVEVESDQGLPMRDFVIEHIVTIVGEYVREVEFSAQESEVFLTNTALTAGSKAKSLRNKGLAHELFNFNRATFQQELVRDIYPSQQDFAAIHYITEAKTEMSITMTSLLYARLGWAYARISCVEEAIGFYIKAQETFFMEVPQNELEQNSVVGQHGLIDLGITQPRAIMIDFNKVMFGLSVFELSIYRNLQLLYLQLGDTQSALGVYAEFLSRINYDRLCHYTDILPHARRSAPRGSAESLAPNILALMNADLSAAYNTLITDISSVSRPFVIGGAEETELLQPIADLFSGAGKALMMRQQYEAAIRPLSQAFHFITGEITSQQETTNISCVNVESLMDYYIDLAQCYFNLNNFKLAHRFSSEVLNNGSLGARLTARFLQYYVEPESQGKTVAAVAAYEAMIVDSCAQLKSLYGDKYIVYLEHFYRVKLDYLIYTGNFSEVKSYLEQRENNYNGHGITQFHQQFKQLYPSICNACLSYFKAMPVNGNREGWLSTAKYYCERYEESLGGEASPELERIKYSLAEAKKNMNDNLGRPVAGLANFYRSIPAPIDEVRAVRIKQIVDKYELKDDSQPELERACRKAAYNGKAKDLKVFMALGISVIRANASGLTALDYAVQKSHVDCVELLLQSDFDENALRKALLLATDDSIKELVNSTLTKTATSSVHL